MTLRSLKKRPITAPTFTLGKRISLAWLLAVSMTAGATAQSPTSTSPLQGLRPVPKTQSQLAPAEATEHQPRGDGWDLKWRKSPELPADASAMADDSTVATSPPRESLDSNAELAPIQQVSSLHPVGHQVELTRAPVAAAAWTTPQVSVGQNAPIATNEPNAMQPIPAPQPVSDFFTNPFGDDPGPVGAASPRSSRTVQNSPPLELPPAPSVIVPPAAAPSKPAIPALPSTQRPMNDLRNELQSPQLSAPGQPGAGALPSPAKPGPAKPSPAQPARPATPDESEGPSLREMLQRERPSVPGDTSKSPSDRNPLDRDQLFDNPFPRRDARDRAADDKSRAEAETPRKPFGNIGDQPLVGTIGRSCDDFRKSIATQSIRNVSLDISPPFRPDIISEDEYEKLKAKFDEKQAARQWRSLDGKPLASGRLVDLAYEKAVIKTEYGATEELSINRLSEADLAYIAENWGLPTECLLEQVAFEPRDWTRTLMTWKASNLCHKPLYFEEVNLERYGHTAGPFLQPIVSSAHFFANIAVLPYKMGIHPPGECQYALGYYRPGDCAPWIVPPIPISLRGGLTQAAALTGAFWLIP